jgi:hypothetical protein
LSLGKKYFFGGGRVYFFLEGDGVFFRVGGSPAAGKRRGWEMPRRSVTDGWFFVHLLPCQFDLPGRIALYLTEFKEKKHKIINT